MLHTLTISGEEPLHFSTLTACKEALESRPSTISYEIMPEDGVKPTLYNITVVGPCSDAEYLAWVSPTEGNLIFWVDESGQLHFRETKQKFGFGSSRPVTKEDLSQIAWFSEEDRERLTRTFRID